MTGRVIGPGGRGVVVATPDPAAALEDVAWLRDAGITATRPGDQGLVRCSPVRFGGPEDPRAHPWAEADQWAAAVRRASLVTTAGRTRCIAADGHDLDMRERADAESIRGAMERTPASRVAVFGGAWVSEDEPEYGEAHRFGGLLAEAGIEVVNGGYGGIMAGVSRGARAAGGRVVGVTISAFSETVPVNAWLTHEVEARDLFARLPLICDAEAWVAFPGGVGTLSEVALCWNLVQTESVDPRLLVIVGERWDRALRAFRDLLRAEREHFELVRPAASAESAMEAVREALGR